MGESGDWRRHLPQHCSEEIFGVNCCHCRIESDDSGYMEETCPASTAESLKRTVLPEEGSMATVLALLKTRR